DITLNPTYLPDPDGGRGRWLVGFHPGIGLGAFNRITETDQYGNPLDITQIPGVRRLNFGQSLARGINEAVFASRSVFFVLRQLFTGQLGMDVLMGPVGIVDAIGGGTAASLEVGVSAAFWTIMNFVLIISANLGVLNLLPIPALDGGRMIFLILEAIRGKPIKPEREGIVHLVGFVLLMGLAVFIAYNDIVRLF
ncbi:MAG: site-2 protease family protein, partial [Defluviitaleaceae bacterium]|nr:site-2 protease family protein [Defluviitaleaceae bacterium]